MILINSIQKIVEAGAQQLISWVTGLLPELFLFLILLNAVTSLIGRARVERLAAKCGSNAILRYMLLPFLSAVVLGNPMAISMGRYLPERYKPAYFASASYHCHTNSGLFQHINPAELFLWLGIANGVLARGCGLFPLALRYMAAGLVANFVSGYATELITRQVEKRQGIKLDKKVDLWTEREEEADSDAVAEAGVFSDAEEASVAVAEVGELSDAEEASVAVADTGGLSDVAAAGNATGGNVASGAVAGYRTITITRGDGGYGGPLTIMPTEERHKVIYMTGGSNPPEPLAKIIALSGMESVNGNKETCPDEEVALAIIDCGGTLRCGIYPGKGIPTVNILATGKSGPLAKYMTEDLYVSAVTSECVSAGALPAAGASTAGALAALEEEGTEADMVEASVQETEVTDAKMSHARESVQAETLNARETNQFEMLHNNESVQAEENAEVNGASSSDTSFKTALSKLLVPVLTVSKVISLFQQAARDAVKTCLEMILPFMGFAALFIGICKGSGLTQFLAGLMKPMGGSLPGLMGLGIICSIPGLSAILGAGAVAAQMFSTVIGELIAAGSIPPAMALPALFAINCQCACDFIPVGLGMTEAKPETTQVGIASVTISRFVTGWIRILIAVVFSAGLYR